MPIYLIAAVGILSALLSGFGTWRVQEWRHDSIDMARIEAAAEKAKFDRRAVDVAAVAHEKDKERIRTVTRTVTKQVERIVREKFYVDRACLNDDGLRQLSEAIGTPDAPGQPAIAVSRPDAPR